MLPRCSGIYKITNRETGKIYVGSAVNFRQRWHSHRGACNRGDHKNPHLQSAWRKYGAAAFAMQPLLFCAVSDLLFYEQLCIDAYRAVAKGYNKAPRAGSCIGIVRDPEYIARMAATKRGVPMSPEAKAAHAAAMSSPETRARISASKRGVPVRPRSDAHRAALSSSQLGHVVTAETRAKLAAANIGKKNGPHSSETKSKISMAQKGRPLSAEHVAAIRLGWVGRRERARQAACADNSTGLSAVTH